jgi:hypothetical protein
MGSSSLLLAKRAFVKLLLALAAAYTITLAINRDSDDDAVTRAYRQVARKTHPDKGGSTKDAQQLNNAKDVWEKARSEGQFRGRPSSSAPPQPPPPKPARQSDLADPEQLKKKNARKEKRIHTPAVMMTYSGIRDYKQWRRFVAFVSGRLRTWGVKHWCATLEKSKAGNLHIHLYLQFHRKVDKTTRAFVFENIAPNASSNDYRGEGLCRRRVQESMDRGFFYVWADKIGTQRDPSGKPCAEGNYMPVWTTCSFTFPVLGKWAFNLWKDHKLTHDVYNDYLFHCRDAVISRKRNLDAVRAHEEEKAENKEIVARVKRIRSNPRLFKKFPEVPAATTWLQQFQNEDSRYSILVVSGPSRSGKTEWAKSLFQNPLELKVGTLVNFPDRMRSLNRDVHDGVILDDIRDLEFIVHHQEKLQGKYDYQVEFASTQGGQCAFSKDLFAMPIVATINNSTKNLHLLRTDDWLGHPENRVIVTFTGPAWTAGA